MSTALFVSSLEGPDGVDDFADTLGWTVEDLSAQAIHTLIHNYRQFLTDCASEVGRYMYHTQVSRTEVAHDYVMVWFGSGVGFTDRCYCGECDQVSRYLSDQAAPHVDPNLVVADDGQLVIE